MLGWCILVFASADGTPAEVDPVKGRLRDETYYLRVALWEEGVGGIQFLLDMVDAGLADHVVTSGGYPEVFATNAGALTDSLKSFYGPDEWPRSRFRRPAEDQENRRSLSGLAPERPVLVEVWDES